MYELLVLAYVTLHLIYVIYAKKNVDEISDKKDTLGILGKPIVMKVLKGHKELCLNGAERVSLKQLYGAKNLEKGKNKYVHQKIGLIYLVLGLGGFFALVLGKDYSERSLLGTTIERPAYGEEPLVLEVQYELDSEEGILKKSMPLVIEAKVPSGEEAQQVLEAHFQLMAEVMLGENNLQNHVIEDLNFNHSPFEAPIRVTYASLTADFLSDQGEIRRNNMVINGSYEVAVLVTMVLSDRQIENVYDFILFREPMSLDEELNKVGERIDLQADKVVLPNKLMERDSKLTWHERVTGTSAGQVLALTIMMSVLIFIFRKEELNRELQERKLLILIDFPDVVTKLTMLINAGMTLSRAWNKIVTDYQERQVIQRPLYEEMLVTTTQIQNGMPEKEAMEDFGRRTASKEVMRMTAILIQNLRRGNHSLTEALKQLSIEAWDIRTNSAKMLGEKASTKLLLPMGIGFVTVIIIVLAPTLMSMKL